MLMISVILSLMVILLKVMQIQIIQIWMHIKGNRTIEEASVKVKAKDKILRKEGGKVHSTAQK